MKPSTAANLALLLAVLAWPLAYYGAMLQLGDPAPWVPRDEVVAMRQRATLVLLLGVFCLFGSLWLSGYGFSGARMRASIATALGVLPMIAVAWSLL